MEENIKKIGPQDPESKSQDLRAQNIAQLKKLFPQITTEGKIDFDALKEILGEEVETGEEYYRLNWAGKAQARREAQKHRRPLRRNYRGVFMGGAGNGQKRNESF